MNEVTAAITQAVNTTQGKTRTAALKKVRWVLRSGSSFVAFMGEGLTQDRAAAQVYDGRDNEAMKAKFFTALYSAPFIPELV